MRKLPSVVGCFVMLAMVACSGSDAPPAATQPATAGAADNQQPSVGAPDDPTYFRQDPNAPAPFAPRTDLPSGRVIVADVAGEMVRGGIAQDADALYYTVWSYVTGQTTLRRVLKSGGAETSLVGTSDISQIAVDDSFVYFTRPGAGTISRVPKLGGAAEDVIPGQDGPFVAIAVDADHLYWSVQGSDSRDAGLWSSSKSGGTPARVAADARIVNEIAVDGAGGVAWRDVDTVAFLSRSSAAPVTLAGAGAGLGPAVAGGGVFWLQSTPLPDASVAGAAVVAWLPGDGGSSTVAAPLPATSYFSAFAADGRNMYWAAQGSIFEVPVASGASSRQIASPGPTATPCNATYQVNLVAGLLVDSASLYSFEFYDDCSGPHGEIRAIDK